MTDENQDVDPKPGFGETNEKEENNSRKEQGDQKEAGNADKKIVSDEVKERQKIIEDTSSVNYGNIGVEGGVEDLDEDD